MKTSRKFTQGSSDEQDNPLLLRVDHDDTMSQDIRCAAVEHEFGGLKVHLFRGGKQSTVFFPAGTFVGAEWHAL